MDPMSTSMSNDSIEALCHHCGRTFSAFLHEMADQNAKVVCPDCRDGAFHADRPYEVLAVVPA